MLKHSCGKKFLSITLVLFMLMAALAIQISASDYEDDWSKGVIDAFIQRKIITPDADGNVRPHDAITRAEAISVINKTFNFTKTASISYSDVSGSDSFYKNVQIAEAMGYMPNSSISSEFRPNDALTREEMAIILANVLELLPKPAATNKYSDAKAMSAEGKGAIGALIDPMVKVADSLGTDEYFYPQDELIRNIAFGLVQKAEAYYKDLRAGNKQFASVNVAAKATLGDASGNIQNYQNVTVVGTDSTIENVVIWGNLIINSKAGSGNVTLKDVEIKGNVFVYGATSVKFTDVSINALTVNKSGNNISIEILGSSDIKDLTIKSGAEFSAASETLSSVTLTTDIPKGAAVSVTADTVKDFTVKAAGVKLSISVAKVVELNMTRTSTGAAVEVTKGSAVTTATLDSVCAINGAGTVSTRKINANGATIQMSTSTKSTTSSSTTSKTPSNPSYSSNSSSSVTYYYTSPSPYYYSPYYSSYYSSYHSPYFSSYNDYATWFYNQYGYTPTYEQYYYYINNGYGYGYGYGYYGNSWYNGYYPTFTEYSNWFYSVNGYSPSEANYYQYLYDNYGAYSYYWNYGYGYPYYYGTTASTIDGVRSLINNGVTYITLDAGGSVYFNTSLTIPSNCTLVVASGTTLYISSGVLTVNGTLSGAVYTNGGTINGSGYYNSSYLGSSITVTSNADLSNALSSSSGVTYITIPSYSSLTLTSSIPSNKVITNNGTLTINSSITNNGTISNNGTINNYSTLYNYGKINNNVNAFYNYGSGSVNTGYYGTSYWSGYAPR